MYYQEIVSCAYADVSDFKHRLWKVSTKPEADLGLLQHPRWSAL